MQKYEDFPNRKWETRVYMKLITAMALPFKNLTAKSTFTHRNIYKYTCTTTQ